MNFKKKLLYILTFCLLMSFSASCCFAVNGEEVADKKAESRLTCISYRGDTASYPENSLEGVLSAFKKGADMVSVSVVKARDSVFVLAEDESLGNICNAPYESISSASYDELSAYNLYNNRGELTEYKLSHLTELLEKTEEDDLIIVDADWQYRDDIYEISEICSSLHRVFLRTKESAKNISEWVKLKDVRPNVIGIYDGNIIFNAVSHVNTLSEAGMELVQYQSKNHFNVMYGSITTDNFGFDGKASAIAPMYNPDLCGQRSDSENGWNELIKKGFTAIETNNIEALRDYIEKNTAVRSDLAELTEKAEKIETESFSLTSRDNLKDAIKEANRVLEGRIKSLDEAENAYSALIMSMNEMKISDGEETTRGALNVTAGKVIACVLVGAALLCGQIFVNKQHSKKKK